MKSEVKNEMTIKEVDRLIDWLVAHGHTTDEARECIKHIAGTAEPKK